MSMHSGSIYPDSPTVQRWRKIHSEKRKMKKVLCLCRGGRVRSVAIKYWFIEQAPFDCEALAAGLENNSLETREMLLDWADIVVIASKGLAETIGGDVAGLPKTIVLDIGPDIWGTGCPGLWNKVNGQLEAIDWSGRI